MNSLYSHTIHKSFTIKYFTTKETSEGNPNAMLSASSGWTALLFFEEL